MFLSECQHGTNKVCTPFTDEGKLYNNTCGEIGSYKYCLLPTLDGTSDEIVECGDCVGPGLSNDEGSGSDYNESSGLESDCIKLSGLGSGYIELSGSGSGMNEILEVDENTSGHEKLRTKNSGLVQSINEGSGLTDNKESNGDLGSGISELSGSGFNQSLLTFEELGLETTTISAAEEQMIKLEKLFKDEDELSNFTKTKQSTTVNVGDSSTQHSFSIRNFSDSAAFQSSLSQIGNKTQLFSKSVALIKPEKQIFSNTSRNAIKFKNPLYSTKKATTSLFTESTPLTSLRKKETYATESIKALDLSFLKATTIEGKLPTKASELNTEINKPVLTTSQTSTTKYRPNAAINVKKHSTVVQQSAKDKTTDNYVISNTGNYDEITAPKYVHISTTYDVSADNDVRTTSVYDAISGSGCNEVITKNENYSNVYHETTGNVTSKTITNDFTTGAKDNEMAYTTDEKITLINTSYSDITAYTTNTSTSTSSSDIHNNIAGSKNDKITTDNKTAGVTTFHDDVTTNTVISNVDVDDVRTTATSYVISNTDFDESSTSTKGDKVRRNVTSQNEVKTSTMYDDVKTRFKSNDARTTDSVDEIKTSIVNHDEIKSNVYDVNTNTKVDDLRTSTIIEKVETSTVFNDAPTNAEDSENFFYLQLRQL